MNRGKKVARKEKPKREKWVVIDESGRLKYPPELGSEIEGYEEELAKQLAEPADPSHAWRAVPISAAFPSDDGDGDSI